MLSLQFVTGNGLSRLLVLVFILVCVSRHHGTEAYTIITNRKQRRQQKFFLRSITKLPPQRLCSICLPMNKIDDNSNPDIQVTYPTTKITSTTTSLTNRRAILNQALSISAAGSLTAWKYTEVQPVQAIEIETSVETNLQQDQNQNSPRKSKITNSAIVCDSTISVWTVSNGDGFSSNSMLYLLGTAHISEVSASLAGALVRQVHPDAVFVELDQKRIQNLPIIASAANGTSSDSSTLNTISNGVAVDSKSTKKPAILVPTFIPTSDSAITSATSTSNALIGDQNSSNMNWFQRKMLNAAGAAVGKGIQSMYSNLNSAGFEPGEEFAEAIRAGRDIDATIVLGDQDVRITLRRLAEALSMTDFNKLMDPNSKLEQTMTNLLPLPPSLDGSSSNSNSDDPSQFKRELSEYVEKMKSRETVRTIIQELNEIAPNVVRVMLTERDTYMANGIHSIRESYPNVVAVMGLAHVDGVERNLRQLGWKPVPLTCPR